MHLSAFFNLRGRLYFHLIYLQSSDCLYNVILELEILISCVLCMEQTFFIAALLAMQYKKGLV